MNEFEIIDGIIVGAVGGGAGGMAVYFIQHVHQKWVDHCDSRRILNWLQKNASSGKFRSTRAIASWNNVTEDRARFLCSIHPGIHLSTGEKEDMWGLS
ncbi:MAG: hypothetical protein MRY76_15610 [Pseudomonadales bacterium]|nr:hypothetical protein [Pseudomonadales bacterium]